MVGVHQRSPPEDSTGRTTGNQTLLGGGRLNDTDGEEAKGKEREETGELQGTRNPGESGRGGEGEREDQNHHRTGKSNKLNIKGQSLEIIQADVQGMEQHHPIMDRLGGLGGWTYRQTIILPILSK